MAEVDTRARSRVGALVCLHLEQSDTIVELLGDGLLLVLAARGALECTNSIAVVRTNVSDVGIESTAERCVTIADAGSLSEC